MDYNTRVVSNNPVWTGSTTAATQNFADKDTPEQLVVPGWARYMILQPLQASCRVIARTTGATAPADGDPGIEVGAGGSLEVALGPQADIWIQVPNDNDDVECTFFS